MIKFMFDFTISLFGMVILFPVVLILMISIYFISGSPIFFIQKRPGLNGSPFNFYKFRTMTNQKDANDKLLPDKDRINSFGSFLRRTSLDELPSLFNVLKGDMRLIGPRPLLMEYLPLYSKEQMRRHEVKPGITGWAQINGRNSISWEKKFELDVWYVNNQSLWLDIKILLLTIWKVIKREDIDYNRFSTMPKFKGNE